MTIGMGAKLVPCGHTRREGIFIVEAEGLTSTGTGMSTCTVHVPRPLRLKMHGRDNRRSKRIITLFLPPNSTKTFEDLFPYSILVQVLFHQRSTVYLSSDHPITFCKYLLNISSLPILFHG
jgi:hypothetical protein